MCVGMLQSLVTLWCSFFCSQTVQLSKNDSLNKIVNDYKHHTQEYPRGMYCSPMFNCYTQVSYQLEAPDTISSLTGGFSVLVLGLSQSNFWNQFYIQTSKLVYSFRHHR